MVLVCKLKRIGQITVGLYFGMPSSTCFFAHTNFSIGVLIAVALVNMIFLAGAMMLERKREERAEKKEIEEKEKQ